MSMKRRIQILEARTGQRRGAIQITPQVQEIAADELAAWRAEIENRWGVPSEREKAMLESIRKGWGWEARQ